MVFESAHYKRQEDDEESVERPASGRQQQQVPEVKMAMPVSEISLTNRNSSFEGPSANLMPSSSADHLCETDPNSGTGSSGGQVRFVNSTVRYHLGNGSSLWSGRTRLEKILIVLVAGLTLLASTLLIILGKTQEASNAKLGEELCLSPECVKVASTILSDVDLSVDPCEDFYKHACGGWEKLNPIPDGHSGWSMFEKLWEANQLAMKNVLEEDREAEETKENTNSTGAKSKAKDYYVSCMDPNGTIESLGGKPLLQLLDNHLIDWTLLLKNPGETSDKIEEEDWVQNFTSKVATVHLELLCDGFFTWQVNEDDHNSSQHVITLDQGGLTLPNREHYLKQNYTQLVDALKKVMFRVVKLLILDNNEEVLIDNSWQARIHQNIEDVIAFETKLANITIPPEKQREGLSMYHKLTLEELNQELPFLNWTSYFQSAFGKINESVNNHTEIVVYGFEFLQQLDEILLEYRNTTEGQKILDSYLRWHIIKFVKNALSKPYRDAAKILEKALLGKEGHTERWRECVSDTDAAMGYASGAMFVERVFKRGSKKQAQEMIDSIKNAFEQRLYHLKWMDKGTREAALIKARAITDMIGYPSFIEDNSELDQKYAQLKVKKDDYFGNGLASRKLLLYENMRKWKQPVNRTRWSMSPPTVNAYYTPTKNQIVFPAGILQSPFFNIKYPKSINYGAMGVVMGHELSHAFDDQGREYDEVGNMRDWWNNATLQQFKARTKCIEDQYSGYNISAQNVSGSLTLGENIADNGGLQTAYDAYKAWLKEKHIVTEAPLPGLNHTHDQLFFLSFAQVWCSVSTPQNIKLQLLEDHHSPARFRVIGVLSNSREFAKAFQCSKGSRMNPEHKCKVW